MKDGTGVGWGWWKGSDQMPGKNCNGSDNGADKTNSSIMWQKNNVSIMERKIKRRSWADINCKSLRALVCFRKEKRKNVHSCFDPSKFELDEKAHLRVAMWALHDTDEIAGRDRGLRHIERERKMQECGIYGQNSGE